MRRLLLLTAVAAWAATTVQAQVTPRSQMETLDRALTAVPVTASSNFVSWRLLGTDNKKAVTFDLLRNGDVIASGLTKTNYTDSRGNSSSKYQVVVKENGTTTETTSEAPVWSGKFLALQLSRPAQGSDGGTYTPNDMTVGDVDGDGQYELFVKWDPSTSHDNSESGLTDNVYIDCYKVNWNGAAAAGQTVCQLLWRVDLGKNIRAGAHYTQFMVYDFDRDGRAEMMCKTATGSKDGTGTYVNQAATDATIKGHGNTTIYRNSDGHILQGPEYLTVFEGLTGKARHTTWYLPGRAGTGSTNPNTGTGLIEGGSELGKVSSWDSSFWGDKYGNRSERFLAAVAYINGADKPACGIFSRGYYDKAYVWAVSYDGTRLHTEWLHASPEANRSLVFNQTGTTAIKVDVDGDILVRNGFKTAPANTSGATARDGSQNTGSRTLYGNGNHNLSIADVDGDGCDEILWGSAALDNDGTLLYATGLGHGDAIHVGKMIPDREGMQVFQVHEEKLTSAFGSWDLHDARTGEIIWHGDKADSDNGRGMAADLTGKDGWEFWSSDNRQPRSAKSGQQVISKSCTVNFRIYWDGDAADELFDGAYDKETLTAAPYVQKWGGSSFSSLQSFGSAAMGYGQTCNTTKATPCLQADLLGDWREELILWNQQDPSLVNVYTTTTATNYAVPTLMHDHTYRMGICWQNTAYNQPPHLGYYLPDYVAGKIQLKGDVNDDGEVNALDIQAVINAIVDETADSRCDVNGDGEVNALDIQDIINIIVSD